MDLYFILWAVIQYSIYFCCSDYSRLGHRELSHVGLCALVICPVLSWALHSLVTQNAPSLRCIFSACILESTTSSEFWQIWKSSFKLSLETIGITQLDDITYRGLTVLYLQCDIKTVFLLDLKTSGETPAVSVIMAILPMRKLRRLRRKASSCPRSYTRKRRSWKEIL